MSQLKNVNTTDLGEAIRLGCRTMSRVFNADDNDIPFFASEVRPDAYLAFSEVFSEAHVPGRHLNALLNAEDVAGIAIDEHAVEKHTRAAFLAYSGRVALPLNRATPGGAPVNFLPHNVREGLHALTALVQYRASAQARLLAEECIATIFRTWDANSGWDRGYLEGEYGIRFPNLSPLATFIGGLARAVGPLVKYYRATGYAPALSLALVLKEKAVAEFFTEAGEYDPEHFGTHTHSTTCTLSGLAQLAELTSDAPLMARVKAFYDRGLWEIRDALGWVIESAHPDANPDLGEVNNTGDVVETALVLGRWGYPAYYHEAERIVRGHLLPSQLRDTSFIQASPNPVGEDGRNAVADRHLGAFGFPAPYGHAPLNAGRIRFNMDIVGGAVGSLCEVIRHATRFDGTGHWVNLLFDHETPHIKIESPYKHPALRVRLKRPGALFVRMPPWVDAHHIYIPEMDASPQVSNGYLFLASPPVN